MTTLIRQFVVLALSLCCLSACGGGGGDNGGADIVNPPTADTKLVWDNGNWDQKDWQ